MVSFKEKLSVCDPISLAQCAVNAITRECQQFYFGKTAVFSKLVSDFSVLMCHISRSKKRSKFGENMLNEAPFDTNTIPLFLKRIPVDLLLAG